MVILHEPWAKFEAIELIETDMRVAVGNIYPFTFLLSDKKLKSLKVTQIHDLC